MPKTARRLTIAVMATETNRTHARRRGYWLRLARNRAGLTLKQVAVEMGYALRSQTTISLWEQGERDLSDIQLAHIARVYRVPAEVFFRPRATDEEWLDERVRDALRNGEIEEPGEARATG